MKKTLIIVVFIICLNLILAEALARVFVAWVKPAQSASYQFDLKYLLAKRTEILKPNQPSILFLGNSHMKYSIYPELIALKLKQAGLDYDVRNLATDAATPNMNLFLLKTAVAAGIKPQMVVYNVSPITFSEFHQTHPDLTAEDKFQRSYMGQCVYQKPVSWQKQGTCLLEKYSYLFRHRRDLKSQIYPSLKAILDPEYFFKFPIIHEGASPWGWSPGYVIFSDKEFRERMNKTRKLHMPSRFKAVQQQYNYRWSTESLKELQAFCAEHRIPLVLLWIPRHAEWEKQFDYLKISAKEEVEISSRLQQMQDNTHIWVVDWHDRDKDNTHYFDSMHLNVLGGLQLSDNFSKLLLTNPYRALLGQTKPANRGKH